MISGSGMGVGEGERRGLCGLWKRERSEWRVGEWFYILRIYMVLGGYNNRRGWYWC